jgi:hypothetical protein
MAITRRLVAQDSSEENQWLKVDHDTRYIQNNGDEWQFLFGPNSALTTSSFVTKISARFDDTTFNNIQIIGYLYDQTNASVGNAGSCQFTLYKVVAPDWTEQLIITLSGVIQPNLYYYTAPTTSSLGLDFQGGDTLMIEATIVRLGVTYRDRVYINHLGIYDNVTRRKHRNSILFEFSILPLLY